MAISPTSDILLDVANAADPNQVRAATARLAKLASDPSAPADFDAALAKAVSASKPSAANLPLSPTIGAPSGGVRPQVKTATDAYQKFEALLLQSFVEEMLPKDDDLYGDKASSGAYRSMMAEQLADQLARAGGIGIAKAVAQKHPGTHLPPLPSDPTTRKA